MDSKWTYTWTAQDSEIAKGNTKDSAQGPYVTPYGIRASEIVGCKNFQVDHEYPIDYKLSVSGEGWRAQRFHEPPAAPELCRNYQWVKITIPPDVTTIGQLCKHLREKDKNQYPLDIYGEDKVKTTPFAANVAQMLFDYWKNSKYRHAIVKDGFHWHTYSKNPGSIPVSKDGISLEYVLQKVIAVPKTAGAPGQQKKSLDLSSLAVSDYIDKVTACVKNIKSLFDLSNEVMKRRYQVIYRLQAIKAIAKASSSNPLDGMASDGPKIVRIVDAVIPKLQKVLVEQPIANPANSSEARLGQIFSGNRQYTRDAAADLQAERQRLRTLLLTGGEHTSMIKKWLVANHGNFHRGVPAVVLLVEELMATMADGHMALGDCEGPGHDDVLFGILDKLKDGYATRPDDIDGDSPTAVALSFVGKGVGLATTTVGNLAGPPSLSIAILQVGGSIRFAKLAKEAFAELNSIPVGVSTVNIRMAKWDELSNRLVKHIPDENVQNKVKLALATGDRKTLAGLRSEVGEALAGPAQTTKAWKGSIAVLSLISAILSIRDAANAPNNRSFPLQVLDFASVSTSIGSASLGTYEAVMTAFGKFDAVSSIVTKAGNVIGIVGAVTGTIAGVIAFAEAAEQRKELAMVSNALGVAGSVGIGLVAACAVLGAAAPLAAAVALACTLASGAVTVVDMLNSLDNTTSKAQKLCHGLAVSVRKDVFGQFAEWADSTIVFGMEDLEEITKTGYIPSAKNDYFVVMELARAGVSESMIREVVNSSAIANTPFGPGLAGGI